MRKIIAFIITLLFICVTSQPAYASWPPDDIYTEDGKIKVCCLFDIIEPKPKLTMELPKVESAIPELIFMGADGKLVKGTVTYPNINDIKVGIFDLQWVFVPVDDKYESISGFITFEVWPEDSEESKGKIIIEDEESDLEPTSPSLTATTISLTKNTAYDINLNNKISGSKYKWTSSNPKVAKVNEKNGLVTAISEGTAIITCEITLPDSTVTTLKSKVVVEYDDNATVLSDTEVDLEVGDKYTLKVENAPARAKYKFTSSNKSIAKVGTTSGKVTAVNPGEAYITCTITTPDNQVIVLRCDVTVNE